MGEPRNPYENFDIYDTQRENQLDRLPVCSCCNEPIQQERAFYYNDQWFCEDCEDEAWELIKEDTRRDYLELCIE